MYRLYTEIEINADAQKVWDILTDTAKFPEWNPFIREILGELREGEQIMAVIQPVNGKAMTFHPKVLEVVPRQKVRWLGAFLFKGLFDGEHIWELEELGEGKTKMVQAENFTGILVPLFKKELENKTKPGFVAMNEKLKELAEAA